MERNGGGYGLTTVMFNMYSWLKLMYTLQLVILLCGSRFVFIIIISNKQ